MFTYGTYTHNHISERETAHTWPTGEADNSAWEDCLWDSIVEVLDFAGVHLPLGATHAEAEALRHASGQGPTGGSNFTQVRAGVKARYGITLPPSKSGYAATWAALQPGYAGVTTGLFGNFAASDPIRRFGGSFTGGHAIVNFRLDSTQRLRWCDPLAPETVGGAPYDGEWVAPSVLATLMKGDNGSAIVLKLNQYANLPGVPTMDTTPVYYTVRSGNSLSKIAIAHGITLAKLQSYAWNKSHFGSNWALINVGDKVQVGEKAVVPPVLSLPEGTRILVDGKVYTYTISNGVVSNQTAHTFSHSGTPVNAKTTIGGVAFFRASKGTAFAGQWFGGSGITYVPAPPPPPPPPAPEPKIYTQKDLDTTVAAAVKAEKDRGTAALNAAVKAEKDARVAAAAKVRSDLVVVSNAIANAAQALAKAASDLGV